MGHHLSSPQWFPDDKCGVTSWDYESIPVRGMLFLSCVCSTFLPFFLRHRSPGSHRDRLPAADAFLHHSHSSAWPCDQVLTSGMCVASQKYPRGEETAPSLPFLFPLGWDENMELRLSSGTKRCHPEDHETARHSPGAGTLLLAEAHGSVLIKSLGLGSLKFPVPCR